MKRYQIEFTRYARAERPAESVILSDSYAVMEGLTISQATSSDSWFLFSGDLQYNMDRMMSTSSFNPHTNKPGEGWRVLEYPHGDKLTYATEARSLTSQEFDMDTLELTDEIITIYADITLRVMGELTTTSTTFTGVSAYSEAVAVAGTIGPSDGYVLIDNLGSMPTQVISSRPSLWIDEEQRAKYAYRPIRGLMNVVGRDEYDRF